MRALRVPLLLFATLFSTLAYATAQRTFVSTGGNDENVASNCSLVAPCRSFGAAIGVTLAGGEVIVLDSGGYGSVTITQGATIESPAGVYAGITVSSGTGIVVNAPGSKVVLRGLTINGTGGNVGIDVQAADRFELTRSVVSGMAQRAIDAHAPGSRNVIADVRVSDTGGSLRAVEVSGGASADLEHVDIARSGGPGLFLVNVGTASVRDSAIVDSNLSGLANVASQVEANSSAIARASIVRVTVNGSTANCLAVFGNGPDSSAFADVSQSVFANCSTANAFNAGIRGGSASGGFAYVAVTDCIVRNSGGTGVDTFGSATLSVSRSTIVDNVGFGIENGGGIVYSRVDNTVRGNNGQETTNQTNGTITPLPAL